jgi:hypothetical protein
MDRLRALAEIRLNSLVHDAVGKNGAAELCCGHAEFVHLIGGAEPGLGSILRETGKAERLLSLARTTVLERTAHGNGRLPLFFNADASFGSICYAMTRWLQPEVIVECGVGYGVTTAVMLAALVENGHGRLFSIDLPSLRDPSGEQTGLAVSAALAEGRWSWRLGSSRRHLAAMLDEIGRCDLFISDSADVATLQRYEWHTVQPSLSPDGGAVFNAASRSFARDLRQSPSMTTWLVRQIEKPPAVTAVVLPRRRTRPAS